MYEVKRRAQKFGSQVESISIVAVEALWTGFCGICSGALERVGAHLDHVVPLALGGAHKVDNLQWSHARCNIGKGGRNG
jgi:5-methylcytosine-specific restriction endonuclease McrA